jgi:hypothetical protein
VPLGPSARLPQFFRRTLSTCGISGVSCKHGKARARDCKRAGR